VREAVRASEDLARRTSFTAGCRQVQPIIVLHMLRIATMPALSPGFIH
jgi:hypothetical protein